MFSPPPSLKSHSRLWLFPPGVLRTVSWWLSLPPVGHLPGCPLCCWQICSGAHRTFQSCANPLWRPRGLLYVLLHMLFSLLGIPEKFLVKAECHLLWKVFPQQPERESHSVLRAAFARLSLPIRAWRVGDGSVRTTNSQPLLSGSSPQAETEVDSYNTFTLYQCV